MKKTLILLVLLALALPCAGMSNSERIPSRIYSVEFELLGTKEGGPESSVIVIAKGKFEIPGDDTRREYRLESNDGSGWSLWLALHDRGEDLGEDVIIGGHLGKKSREVPGDAVVAFLANVHESHRAASMRDLNGFSLFTTKWSPSVNLRTVQLAVVRNEKGQSLSLRAVVQRGV